MARTKKVTLEDEDADAGFGLETHHFFEESESEEDQPQDIQFPGSLSEDGRLRLRPRIVLQGAEYSGTKSIRKYAFGEEDEKWQLAADGVDKKRHHATHSDSEFMSDEELESGEDDTELEKVQPNEDMEDLTKEYTDMRKQEENLLKELKEHGDVDWRKGQAVKNQKVLWDKALEIRISLQKIFTSSNKLPQASVKSSLCNFDVNIQRAYSELVTSTRQTLDSLLDLQEALIEKNTAVCEAYENGDNKLQNEDLENKELFSDTDTTLGRIQTLYSRIIPFRNSSVDKWQRKTQLSAGAAAMKSKLRAFNQSISQQVSACMRDPTRMIKRMQMMQSSVVVLGTSPQASGVQKAEEMNEDGDPELLDDSEFYQQLLREFLESTDPTSLATGAYSLRKLQNKKRKAVDRRASKSRKIRYNVHEKIVNFMAPEPISLPSMAPKLFSNLFGQKTSQPE